MGGSRFRPILFFEDFESSGENMLSRNFVELWSRSKSRIQKILVRSWVGMSMAE